MWYVYVLKSQKNGKIYVGMSQDIDRRLAEHNSGKSKFTSGPITHHLLLQILIRNQLNAFLFD
ncbi:MAG: GIY-YIG nuclease family protein [Bacteroidetes bacterium CHB5]|nr:GIY-YIG nuclease family protein [Bacteroidetes bacterium CHB5]